jgi:O-antigen/teichoic acid export membrane protein
LSLIEASGSPKGLQRDKSLAETRALPTPAGLRTVLSTRLRNSEFGRAVLGMAGGTAGAQFIGILSAPLMSRVFAPGETGVVAVLSNLLSICGGLAMLRYEQAIPLPKTQRGRTEVALLCFAALGISSALALSCVGFGRAWIASCLKSPAVTPYLWVLPLGLLTAGSALILQNWFVREKDFRTVVGALLAQSVSQITFQLTFGVVTHGNAWVLAFGPIVGCAAGTWAYLRNLGHDVFGDVRCTAVSGLLRTAREYRHFPMFNSWSGMLQLLAQTIPVLSLAGLYGTNCAGWYRMAQTMVTLPIAAICSAVSSVYTSEAARLMHTDIHALRRLYLRITLRMAGLGSLLVIASFSLPFLVPPLFGQRWAPAGRYAIVMSFGTACSLAIAPAVNLCLLKRNHWDAIWAALRAALMVGVVWVAATWQLSPLQVLAGFSLVMCLSYAVYIFLNLAAIDAWARSGLAGSEPAGQPNVSNAPVTYIP